MTESRGPAPAARHKGSLKKIPLPKPPSFDEKDISDKPRFLRPANRLKPKQKKVLRVRNQRRLESLASAIPQPVPAEIGEGGNATSPPQDPRRRTDEDED